MSTSYFNIKRLPTKQAFIFIDITCQHPFWGYPVYFFLHIIYYTFHFIIANLSMVGLLPSVAAVEFLLKIAEQNNDLRKGVLPCETSRRGVPSS